MTFLFELNLHVNIYIELDTLSWKQGWYNPAILGPGSDSLSKWPASRDSLTFSRRNGHVNSRKIVSEIKTLMNKKRVRSKSRVCMKIA